jgi:hypothetical protein
MMQQAASMPALKGVVFVADAINDDPGYYGIGRPATGTFTDTPYPAYALEDAGSANNTAIINALEAMPPPPQLQLLIRPTSRLFNSYHEAAFQPLIIEAFYNSTSNSVYTQVVWPSQHATASPQFGIFP